MRRRRSRRKLFAERRKDDVEGRKFFQARK